MNAQKHMAEMELYLNWLKCNYT